MDSRVEMDRKALLGIFPEEVWMLILDSIKDPETLECLKNSSLVFREFLRHRRVQFLFPKFWDIICMTYHKEASPDFGDSNNAYRETPANNSLADGIPVRTRWFSGITKLRLVCRTWCDAVDHWYEKQQHIFNSRMFLDGEDAMHPGDLTVTKINRLVQNIFFTSDSLELFNNHFEASHSRNSIAIRNPFLGRSIRLFIGIEDRPHPAVRYMDQATKFLSTYGSYIWYLTIQVFRDYGTVLERYSAISTFLHAAPNIRKLALFYEEVPTQPEPLHTIAMREEWSELQSYIVSNPLPNAANLQFITTRDWSFEECVPQPLFHELIRANSQVTMLEIGHPATTFDEYRISSGNVPNLRELSLRLETQVRLESFLASNNEWRLEKLDLELEEAISVEWSHIFRGLGEKWGNSLRRLTLDLPDMKREDYQKRLIKQGASLRLDLPHLTHLYLIMPNLCCLDFLLPMKESLEDLELLVNVSVYSNYPLDELRKLEEGKVIQLLSNPTNPMESNLWTLFPRLRRLNFNYQLISTVNASKSIKGSKKLVSRSEWQSSKKNS